MMIKPLQIKSAPVLSHRKVSAQARRISLYLPSIAKASGPGQFLHLRIPSGSSSPLLRRPFSINDVQGNGVSVLYEVKGTGTELLSGLRTGDTLDVVGPLGKGFVIEPRRKDHLLVAGGMGLAPMGLLVRRLTGMGLKPELLYGCRSSAQLMRPGLRGCRISSEDGSCGRKGLVTSLLLDRLKICRDPAVYTCGPWPMLRAVAGICRDRNIPCQVSLESLMACGVGACQGCVVRSSDGSYISVCDKGPVFDSRRIDWDQDCVI